MGTAPFASWLGRIAGTRHDRGLLLSATGAPNQSLRLVRLLPVRTLCQPPWSHFPQGEVRERCRSIPRAIASGRRLPTPHGSRLPAVVAERAMALLPLQLRPTPAMPA